MSETTQYRFLTCDESLEPGQWRDSGPYMDEIRSFSTREDLLAFVRQLENEGWELISATTRTDTSPVPAQTPLESWVFSRPVSG